MTPVEQRVNSPVHRGTAEDKERGCRTDQNSIELRAITKYRLPSDYMIVNHGKGNQTVVQVLTYFSDFFVIYISSIFLLFLIKSIFYSKSNRHPTRLTSIAFTGAQPMHTVNLKLLVLL